MRAIRVTYADGNTIETNINGTMEEIRAYYVGQSFQFGDTEEHPADRLVTAIAVEDISNPDSSQSYCQRCVWETHPEMLSTYSLRGLTCARCGRVTDLALVIPTTKHTPQTA